MNQPRTLHEYIQMRNLQRKRENYLVNETKNFPNPLSLDKQKKIDLLIIQILDFVKHITGQGPIFHRFRIMMQNLYKIFQKQLSQFHNIGLANKFNSNQAYIQEMKKANYKLKEYLQTCQKESKEVNNKLQHLVKGNKELNTNMIFIKKNSSNKVEIQDKFQEDQQKPEKIVKIGKIEIESNKPVQSPFSFSRKQQQSQSSGYLKDPKISDSKSSKEAMPQFLKKI